MTMSIVARDFLRRHCDDWGRASRYAIAITYETSRASVVSDPLVSYSSIDRVIGAHMHQNLDDDPWRLEVEGYNYFYYEEDEKTAFLTLYDADLAPSQIVYAVNEALPLAAVVGGSEGKVPFFSSDQLVILNIESIRMKHPYKNRMCAALKIDLGL